MPEIAEISRIVHFLRLRLVGQTIATATAIEDGNVFGKVGTSGKEVEAALKGRKVVSAGNQGKYFWIVLDKPPHLVMHFGMTGWIHIRGDRTAYTNYYKKMKDAELQEWPPKYWKFHLKTEGEPGVEVAFTDPRRFGRVRLVDCPGSAIRQHSPLVENGPDPVVDLDRFTEAYLGERMRARHVPIKALLLDQTTISGIGNWVADETLYQAKLHPEQYSNTFQEEEVKRLFENVRYVCQTAVDKLGNSDEFPEHWMFNYRWGKGGKDAVGKLPNGDRIAFITVGGRTSCYAPDVQKKTGSVVPGIKEEGGDEKVMKISRKAEASANGEAKRSKRTAKAESGEDGTNKTAKRAGPEATAGVKRGGKRRKAAEEKDVKVEDVPLAKVSTVSGEDNRGRRRSMRLGG